MEETEREEGQLEEGDRVGVLRTGQGDLIFFVNGVSQGVAASSLPVRVHAVVDMYGKCAQVTLTDNSVQEARIQSNDMTNVATAAAATAEESPRATAAEAAAIAMVTATGRVRTSCAPVCERQYCMKSSR